MCQVRDQPLAKLRNAITEWARTQHMRSAPNAAQGIARSQVVASSIYLRSSIKANTAAGVHQRKPTCEHVMLQPYGKIGGKMEQETETQETKLQARVASLETDVVLLTKAMNNLIAVMKRMTDGPIIDKQGPIVIPKGGTDGGFY